MPLSRPNRSRSRSGKSNGRRDVAPAAYRMPLTASHDALLESGSDRKLRALISNLFTIAGRMTRVREHLGRRMGITGPQYSLVVAVAHLQGQSGISVGTIAQALQVSSAFVASESGKLARRGLLLKRTNPDDRRSVLLSIGPAGRLRLERVSPEIRAINDLLFGFLNVKAFAAFASIAASLEESSGLAEQHVDAVASAPNSASRAAG